MGKVRSRAITSGARPAAGLPWRLSRGHALPPCREREIPHARAAIAVVKVAHSLAWFSIESCLLYLLYAGFAHRSDRRAGLAAAVVAGESLIFAGNRFRCPLTQLAERLGAERGSVTHLYLPRWFADNLHLIHMPLIALAACLHGRNLRRPDRAGGQGHRTRS